MTNEQRGSGNRFKSVEADGISYYIRQSEDVATADNSGFAADTIVLEGAFEHDIWKIFYDAYGILISKHRDYGPANIANAPGGALNGVRVRIHDKIARINHLIDNNKNPEHESLRDSFLDLMNYAAISMMVIDKKWPGLPND